MLVILSFPLMLALMGMKDNAPVTEIPQLNSGFQKSLADGKKIYKKYCLTCHQADGSGVPNMTPPLIQTSYVLGDKEKLINIIFKGLKNVDIDDQTYNNAMPALGSVLKDQEIADVLSYIRNDFGNKASIVTLAEVKAARSKSK